MELKIFNTNIMEHKCLCCGEKFTPESKEEYCSEECINAYYEAIEEHIPEFAE